MRNGFSQSQDNLMEINHIVIIFEEINSFLKETLNNYLTQQLLMIETLTLKCYTLTFWRRALAAYKVAS